MQDAPAEVAGTMDSPHPSPPPVAATAAAAVASDASPPTASTTSCSHLKTGGMPLTHEHKAEAAAELSEEVIQKMKALKIRRKHRFLCLEIIGSEVQMAREAPPSAGPSELKEALPASDCRYVVYDHEYVTYDQRKASKLLFISWLPNHATPHAKMAYTHGKLAVRRQLEGFIDVVATTFDDISTEIGEQKEDSSDSEIDF